MSVYEMLQKLYEEYTMIFDIVLVLIFIIGGSIITGITDKRNAGF